VTLGVGARDALITHAGHFRRMLDGRPHVILKIAVSADGKTGQAGRRPASISCSASRAEAHMMRAFCDAILVGSGTVIADDPMLNCRLPGMEDRSPIRVVLDGSLRTPLGSKLVRTAREIPLWVVAGERASKDAERKLVEAGAEVIRVRETADGKMDLHSALGMLGERRITRVLVEGGPILSATLLKADLIDEAVVVQSPQPLGADAIDALEGMPLTALTASPHLQVIEQRMAGADSFTRYFRH
jgi:diaminohydroxyphosphoribosylaminopyrimidine deaminase / 5-amino-6-(5-phosphoribosylamino)uracil reductase